jgi:hypothetical protein
MKTSIIDKLNECVDYLSTVNPMKLPVHKIQSRFTNCVVEFVKRACLTCIEKVYVNSYNMATKRKLEVARDIVRIFERGNYVEI